MRIDIMRPDQNVCALRCTTALGAQGIAVMESTAAYWCKGTKYVQHLLVLRLISALQRKGFEAQRVAYIV